MTHEEYMNMSPAQQLEAHFGHFSEIQSAMTKYVAERDNVVSTVIRPDECFTDSRYK